MAQKQNEKSHFIPKVYLNRFTDADGRLYRLKTEAAQRPYPIRPRAFYPAGVGFQKGFYDFNEVKPADDYEIGNIDELERSGFLYENDWEALVDKILTSKDGISIQEAYDCATILFDLKIRSKYAREKVYNRENIEKGIDQMLVNKQQYQALLAENGGSKEKVAAYIQQLKDVWLKDDASVKQLHNVALWENKQAPHALRLVIYNKLMRGDWHLYQTTPDWPFITSDNPGYCFNSAGQLSSHNFYGDTSLFFPLTAHHLLVIYIDDLPIPVSSRKAIGHHTVDTSRVVAANVNAWRFAHEAVFSNQDTALQQVCDHFRQKTHQK